MTPQGFKRKLTAILSADVKGYSRLMGEDDEATVRTITTYRKVITKVVQKYRGRVVDSPGDNILAEFSSVIDAVSGAVEIQEELRVRNSELPEERKMEFRIGVNLGDVIHEEDRIYGDGVNVAARVEGLADPGGICVSGTVFDQIESKLPLGYEFLGEQSVKNISKPVRIYKALMDPDAVGKVIGDLRAKPRREQKIALVVLTVLLLIVGGLLIWRTAFPPVQVASVEKMAFPLPDRPSIAVLPFDNLSKDPEQDYFSDGLTEEIITGLSNVPRLFVISRNSTFTYKGKPVKVQQVAEDLGVRYVLEGSVRKTGNKVRITAQLIDALQGYHLWAERYDRDLKDIFAVQDEITKKIITAMQVELAEGEQARGYARSTENLEAYLKFLQGRQYFQKGNKENNLLAQQMAKKAITLDPEYSAAYYLLAFTHYRELLLGSTKTPKRTLIQSIKMAQKAISLNDSLVDAHAFLGWLYTVRRQHEKGIAEAERASALSANSADAYHFLGGTLNYAGRHEEAIQMFKKAIRFSPIPRTYTLYSLCIACRDSGRYEKGISAAKKALDQDPDSIFAHTCLASCYALLGRDDEAQAEAAEVLRIDPKFSLIYLEKRMPYKDPAHTQLVIGSLRKAGLK